MNPFYIHRLIKLVSPINDEVFTIEFGGKEDELKELIATILNVNPSTIKGIRDCYGNYHTISSAIKNTQLTMEYSSFYSVVLNLKNFSPQNSIKIDKSLFPNLNNESPNKRKDEYNFSPNINDPYEIIAFRLYNEKYIDKNKYNILKNLIAEQNNEIITLFKLYLSHGKDINKLSVQLFPILNENTFNLNNNLNIWNKNDSLEIHSIKNFQNSVLNNSNSNMRILNNVEKILKLPQSDNELLRKLLLCDNELIIKALEDYSLNNNLNKLRIDLDRIIQNYGVRFTEPNLDSKKNIISKEYKLMKKAIKIQNKIYKTFSSDNTFLQDCILLFKADMEHLDTKEKMSLFKELKIKESSFPLNEEAKKIIISYYTNKLKNKFFKNYNSQELKVYEELIKGNDENIINAYKKYIINKNDDELSSEIRKWILKVIEKRDEEIRENNYISSSSDFEEEEEEEEGEEIEEEEEEEEEEEDESSSTELVNNNSNNSNNSNKNINNNNKNINFNYLNKDSKEFIITKKTNPSQLLTNNYKLNVLKKQQTKDNPNDEKQQLTLVSLKKAEEIANSNSKRYKMNLSSTDRKLNEFIKVIYGMSFGNKEKDQISDLISNKNPNVMRIFQKYQKNKLSLTKTVLLNLVKNNKNNIKNNNNISNNKINQKENITFSKFLLKMENDNKINKDTFSFLLSEYDDGNKMLRSFWEIYKNGNDDEDSLIENIEIFLKKYGKTLKKEKNININVNEKKNTIKDLNGGKTPISIKTFKKDLINYLKLSEKKDIKLKQKKIIDLLITEKFINPECQEFFYDKIANEDKTFIAACEVFSITLNHLDFSETLNIIYELSKDLNNKDNNNNNSKDEYLNLLNGILDKGNFSDNDKKIAIEEYNKKNNVLMSILEVYEKEQDDENDTIDSLKTLIAKIIHTKLL